MRSKDFLKKQIPKTEIKSKVKFTNKFDELVEETLEYLFDFYEKELLSKFKLDYIEISSKTVKIKVNDPDLFIQKIIMVTFESTKVDEKYWNARVELHVSEVSRKPKFYLVWKFNITHKELIAQKTLNLLIEAIEEISEE